MECYDLIKKARAREEAAQATLEYTGSLLGRDKEFVSKNAYRNMPPLLKKEQIVNTVEVDAEKLRKLFE
jgi:hypothetical protein